MLPRGLRAQVDYGVDGCERCIYRLSLYIDLERIQRPRLRGIPIQEQQRHTRPYQKHQQEEPRISPAPLGLLQLRIRLLDGRDRVIRIIVQPLDTFRLTGQVGNQRRLEL